MNICIYIYIYIYAYVLVFQTTSQGDFFTKRVGHWVFGFLIWERGWAAKELARKQSFIGAPSLERPPSQVRHAEIEILRRCASSKAWLH